MGSNKKDLEIIYHLQWKNGNGTGQNEKSNIVGMYDIPATTLNWETFKSYLLKNSGAMVDNVKVSYVSSDDKEFPIESQLDFQIALYSFRQRARNNDVITLKLERACDNKMLRIKRQRHHVEESVPTAPPATDEIPDWFKNYMKEYKKEVIEEVTASVVNAMSSVKLQALGRKLKESSTKRLRKSAENNDKEIRKTLKLERKIEELEEKTNKMKEKKLAQSRAIESRNRPIGLPASDTEVLMDATPIGSAEVTVSHMSGGEVHSQEWIVINTGSVTWTSETELRYAWGSEALKPIQNAVPCPLLKPGEKGPVAVVLDVPNVAGEYECYWHFCHNGRRFGHWLGCHIIVDPSPIKMLSVHRFDPIDKSITVEPPSAVSWSSQPEKPLNLTKETDTSVDEVSATLDDLALVCSDSDNQSVISIADSNSSIHTARSDEFVVVPIESEIELATEPKIEEKESKYAYINFEGKKQAVPKIYLRSDFLETAEEAQTPEPENSLSLENKRLFVFPLNCPGFEVVYPPNPMSESLIATAWSTKADDSISVEAVEVNTEVKVESSDEKPNMPQVNTTFTTAPSVFPTVPIFPPTMSIPPPTMSIPPPAMSIPPPITIPVPPPRTIPVPPPPIFTYTTPNPNTPWFFSGAPNTQAPPPPPPFAAYGPPPNPNYRYTYLPNEAPYMQSFVYSNSENYSSPLPPMPQTPFENEEASKSPNSGNGSIPTIHTIPETLVSGAVNVASSAINTARSVLNMFSIPIPQTHPMPAPPLAPQSPQEGAPADPNSPREKALQTLREMGFWDRDVNTALLERFHDDLHSVIGELLK